MNQMPVMPVKVGKVADIYDEGLKKQAQTIQKTEPVIDPRSDLAKPSPTGYIQNILPVVEYVDRAEQIKRMIKNYKNTAKLAESHASLWQRVLDTQGQDTDGFLDDPAYWDDKKWNQSERTSEKLLESANDAVVRILTLEEAEMPKQVMESDSKTEDNKGE